MSAGDEAKEVIEEIPANDANGEDKSKKNKVKRKKTKKKKTVKGSHIVFENEDGEEGEAAPVAKTKAEKRRDLKKRKRQAAKAQREESGEAPLKKVKTQKYFKGKVFCITCKGNEDQESTEAKESDGEYTYAKLKEMIELGGGTVSGIVHKRIFALVTTEGAVERKTQRIRKALKYDVPVVGVSFVESCVKEAKPLGTSGFVLEIPADPENVPKQKKQEKTFKQG
mmetsp:Transcript_27141/g.43592  ORF Transcript_27141/g.43592 Transcript_27141/m.43592 type:complete len:225 (+) Transcript_27141:205-879(+)